MTTDDFSAPVYNVGSHPKNVKWCECGHAKGWHRKHGCIAQRPDAKPGDLYCPCPAFTPKKDSPHG